MALAPARKRKTTTTTLDDEDDDVARRARANLQLSRTSRKRQRDEHMARRVRSALKECEEEVAAESPDDERMHSWLRQFRVRVEEALAPSEDFSENAEASRARLANAQAASLSREAVLRARARIVARKIARQRADSAARLLGARDALLESLQTPLAPPAEQPVNRDDLRSRAVAIRDAAVAASDVADKAPAQLDDLRTLVTTVEREHHEEGSPPKRRGGDGGGKKGAAAEVTPEARVAAHFSQLESLALFLKPS